MAALGDARLLRLLIDRLGTAAFGRWEMEQLSGLIWKYGPRRTDLEREDFRQSVLGDFVAEKPAYTALRALSLEKLVPSFRRCLQEAAYEWLLAGEMGTLIKALDGVVRSRPSLSLRRGRIALTSSEPASLPLRIKRADGRYDHDHLADAVEAVLVEFGGPTSKVAVARRLHAMYRLDESPELPAVVETPSMGLLRRQCADQIYRGLSAEEARTLSDWLNGRPLRETGESLEVSTTTVHRFRADVEFEIDAALGRHGLEAQDLDEVLRLVESMINMGRKAA